MKTRRSILMIWLTALVFGGMLLPRSVRADGGGWPTATPTVTVTPTSAPDNSSLLSPEIEPEATAPMPNITAPANTKAKQPFTADTASQPSTGSSGGLGPLGAILLVIVIIVGGGLFLFRRK